MDRVNGYTKQQDYTMKTDARLMMTMMMLMLDVNAWRHDDDDDTLTTMTTLMTLSIVNKFLIN